MYDPIPLTMLRVGQVGQVRQVVGSPEHVRRLEELGIHSGAVVEMVQSGSPCIVRVGDSTLCLRHGELIAVLVAQRMSA
jgi:Fe2+ transport system protein FeoA